MESHRSIQLLPHRILSKTDTLLESENPKYLGTNDGMINVGLMTKLYNVVAHNLNEARKARD